MLRTFFLAMVISAFCLAIADARQPNLVVILADDQGWGDLSVSGNTNLKTPNIDSLSGEGATLEHFYVCQVCAPTRAEFLTGRYYPKTGVSGVSRGEERLNPDETTIADVFQQAGYKTAAFGKWHNGTQPPYHPRNRGFDEFYGFTSGHWSHYFSPPLDHNGKRVRGNGFIADDFTDHAIDFIKASRDQPFFCYVPFNTPHSPMMVPDRYYKKFAGAELQMKHRDAEREDIMMTRAALALCENIDWNVGRLLETVDRLKLRDNTIVVYFSDNGPNSYRWNGGMKGRKGSIDEGGLRSPFFIRWPGHIQPGKRVSEIAGAIDLLPTLADLVDIRLTTNKPLDGRSLKPLLLGKPGDWPERSLFAVKGKQVSLRTQAFRLGADGQLFDIGADPSQAHDVAHLHPKITAELLKQANAHAKEMAEYFNMNSDRPFTVGYGPSTTLTARDGVPHGNIERSSKAPNNSYFKNWTNTDDSITWDLDVATDGKFQPVIYYTCAAADAGCELKLSVDGGDSVSVIITDAFDPPLYDKTMERVTKSHYFMKDFQPQKCSTLRLPKGRATLRLSVTHLVGKRAIDLHSIGLNLLTANP